MIISSASAYLTLSRETFIQSEMTVKVKQVRLIFDPGVSLCHALVSEEERPSSSGRPKARPGNQQDGKLSDREHAMDSPVSGLKSAR